MYHLVVTQPFGQRAAGHVITDAREVEAVQDGPFSRFVQRVFAPVEAPPVTLAKPTTPLPDKANAADKPGV